MNDIKEAGQLWWISNSTGHRGPGTKTDISKFLDWPKNCAELFLTSSEITWDKQDKGTLFFLLKLTQSSLLFIGFWPVTPCTTSSQPSCPQFMCCRAIFLFRQPVTTSVLTRLIVHHPDCFSFGQLQCRDPSLPLHFCAGLQMVSAAAAAQHNIAGVLCVDVCSCKVYSSSARVGHLCLCPANKTPSRKSWKLVLFYFSPVLQSHHSILTL